MGEDHGGHRQRMRERFRTQGLEGFAPHEILELMLFYAIPQKNTNPIAHALLNRFGSLHGVLEASPEELCRVEGVGEYAATMLNLFAGVSRELAKSREGQVPSLQTAEAAKSHCAALLSGLRQEHFYLICLSARLQVLGDVLITRGTLDEAPAYPRLVAEAALRYNAHGVILTHNHPGGTCRPSSQDLETTRRLAALLSGMDIRLCDHIIVAGESTFSLAENGLLPGSEEKQ